MANITFWGNINGGISTSAPSGINHGAGSGLGFYGAGYGISVPVGQYQDSTWVTNGNGTATDQYQLNNTKYADSGTVSYNGGTAIQNFNMPNYYAPLNIRFTHTEAVRVQNCKLRIFDRNDISKQASGVTTKVYEVRHPNGSTSASGLAFRGDSSHNWKTFDPEEGMIDAAFVSSPGMSGLNTSAGDTLPTGEYGFYNYFTKEGSAHQSTRHDWYVGLSASPDSIGSKTSYGLYFTCEYL